MQETGKKPRRWIKLDNAAKIYPSTMSRRWSALFRLSCTLKEDVDPEILSQALASTIKRIPNFGYRLYRGLFWYYLEQVEGIPHIEHDVANPLTKIDFDRQGGYMFRIRYYDCRVALEIFHVLADGTAGMIFLKTLIAEYLRIRYGADIPRDNEILDCTIAPDDEEGEDSFQKYARPVTLSRAESTSYSIIGTPDQYDYLNIITGIMSAKDVHDRAKHYGVTVTEFLVAALVMAIRQLQKSDMSRHRRRQKIKICTPINLRRFYHSNTLRNFSSFINPGIDPTLGEYTFQETATRIKHLIGLDASEKMINARMSKNVADEHNPVLRVAPLFIKDATLKYMYWKNGDRVSSSTLSNLGVVHLPDEMGEFVDRFDFLLGSLLYNPVTCAAITFADKLSVNFTRTIRESEVERHFFSFLVKEGIHVKIESNRRY